MPGVKGKSGRTAKSLDTYYAREKAWSEFASKNPRPAFLPHESSLNLKLIALAKQLKQEKLNHYAGQKRAQHNALRAANAKGAGRVLHAVEDDWKVAERLALQIIQWDEHGLTRSNITQRANKWVREISGLPQGKNISVKAVGKLLDDFAQTQEGQEQ